MITSIQTKHFKALDNVEVDFIQGLNILKGPNGVGKSSLVQALKFALYGVAAVPGKKVNIPTWGKKKAEVIVDMEDGHQIHRTTSDCSISLNGAEVAVGNAPCSAYIADHFALDLKGFEMFHCSNQGETAALLTLGATELQRRVEKHAEVSVIDDTIARARKGALLLAGKIEGYEVISPEDFKALKKSVKASTKLLKTANDVMIAATALKDTAKTNKVSAKEELISARNQNDRAEKLGRRRDKLSGQVTAAERELKSVREELRGCESDVDIEELESSIDVLTVNLKAHNKANQKIDAAIEQRDEMVVRLKSLPEAEKNLQEWDTNLVDIESELELAQKEVDKSTEVVAELKATKLQKQAALTAAEEGLTSAVCVTCNRPFDGQHVEVIEANILKLKTDLDTATDIFNTADDEHRLKVDDLAVTQRELDEHEGESPENQVIKLRELAQDLAEVEEVAGSPYCDVSTNETEIKELEAKATLATADQAKHKRLSKKETSLAEEVDELEVEIEGLDIPDSVNMDTFEAMLEAATEVLLSTTEALGQATVEFNSIGNDDSALNAQLTKIEEDKLKLAEFSGEYSLTNKLVDYLVKSRERFMAEVWDTILGNASHFCSIATKDWSAPDGRSKQITEITRKEGAFFFNEGGINQPIESASGAQRAFMGVGVRLGMSVALKGAHSLLILDEPTSDMANENANALAGSLLSLPGQVIMITHRAYEELSANNVVDLGQL